MTIAKLRKKYETCNALKLNDIALTLQAILTKVYKRLNFNEISSVRLSTYLKRRKADINLF